MKSREAAASVLFSGKKRVVEYRAFSPDLSCSSKMLDEFHQLASHPAELSFSSPMNLVN